MMMRSFWYDSNGYNSEVTSKQMFQSMAQDSNLASSVTLALSRREMGQPAFAPLAMAVNLAWSMPGIFAVMSRCDSVTEKPASVLSSVTVAVAWIDVGVKPALPSSAENAMAKQPECAAAMSSSGLVPGPFSN